MSNLEAANVKSKPNRQVTTLWHCSKCGAFISIHSTYLVSEIFCPACVEMPLDFCGNSTCAPEFQFADA